MKNQPDTLKERLLCDATIQRLTRRAEKHLLEYAVVREKNLDSLFPEQAAYDLKSELAGCVDPDEAEKLRTRLAALTRPGADDARVAARRFVRSKWNECPKHALLVLVLKATTLLLTEKVKAVKTEREFFARHGLTHEPTAVSRRFDQLIEELKTLKSGLQSPQSKIPNPNHSSFVWFGGRITAEMIERAAEAAPIAAQTPESEQSEEPVTASSADDDDNQSTW